MVAGGEIPFIFGIFLSDMKYKPNFAVWYLNTLEQIDTAEDVLKEDSTFEVSTYRLIFALGSSSYNNSEIFKISNRELLLNFVDFIREKINKKIAEIEAELVK